MTTRQFLVPLLYLAALTRIQLSSGFTLRLGQRAKSISFVGISIHNYENKPRQTLLLSTDPDEGDPDETNLARDNFGDPKTSIAATTISKEVSLLMDPGLWASDFLAVIIASQLIGLLNVINNPEFIQNGGWFQPIPAVPSTLDELIIRISSFGILWAIASASVITFSKMTTTPSVSPNVRQNSSDKNDTTVLMKRNVQCLIAFGVLQVVANGIVFALGYGNVFAENSGLLIEQNSAISWLEILRNCYYVGLSTSGFRFLYGRYFLFL